MSSWLADRWANAPLGWGRAAIAGIQSGDENRYRQLSHGVAKQNAATAATNAVTSAGSLALREKIEPRKLDQVDIGHGLEEQRLIEQREGRKYQMTADQAKLLEAAFQRLGPKLTPEDRIMAERAYKAGDRATGDRIIQNAAKNFQTSEARLEYARRNAGTTGARAADQIADEKSALSKYKGELRVKNPDWKGPLPMSGEIDFRPGETAPVAQRAGMDPAQKDHDNARRQAAQLIPKDDRERTAIDYEMIRILTEGSSEEIKEAVRVYVEFKKAEQADQATSVFEQ